MNFLSLSAELSQTPHKITFHSSSPSQTFIRGVILLALMLLVSSQAQAMPRTEQELRAIKENMLQTSVIYGQIPAIVNPSYIPVRDANMILNAPDPVFVAFLPDGPRIYPQRILVWHEVVNDVVDGHAYTITYSPISGCVAAYDSQVNGVNLTFDTQGQLYNANSVLIDRNTGSLWMQLIGMAFDGPLTGRGMKQIPIWWTTWGYASKIYPNAKVLAQPRSTRKPYGRDPYGSYLTPGNYYDDQRILYPVGPVVDRRMNLKQRVLGLELDGLMLAVNEDYVRQRKVVNFFMGPTPMVALLDPRLNVIRIFNRNVWGKDVLFLPAENGITDLDTGTLWSYDGRAGAGNLSGASIEEHTGIYAFWFVWAAFHPETLLVPGSSVVPDSALQKGVQ